MEYNENPISAVRFVKINELEEYGFTNQFKNLVLYNFPQQGNYVGNKKNIGL